MSDTEKYNPDWNAYYKNKSNQVPREILIKVLDLFDGGQKSVSPLYAIDIGCGHGADTLELLKRGWKVLAIDNNDEGLSLLEESVRPDLKQNLKVSNMSFENIKLDKCDLVNAGFSIPFCSPEYFMSLWNKIESSIVKGGRFSGNFFGVNDEWADSEKMTFHTQEEILKLFDKFEIEYFHERDEDGTTASGQAKHWHVFSVIARKS